MDVRSLGFRTDLALLGLGGSTIDDRGDHLIVRSPHNPSYWWGNFLLLSVVPDPQSAQAWVDRFAAAFPRAGHVTLGFDFTDGTSAELAWFADHGFDVEVSAVMTAHGVHQPRRTNTQAVCRALESDDDWRQSVELRTRCFGAEAASPDFVQAKTEGDRDLVRQGDGVWFGAFLDGRLVAELGLVRAGDDDLDRLGPDAERAGHELARFQSVETHPEFRRQGLAGTLAHRAARFGLEELGARTLVMVADPDYFAIDLYRSPGFQTHERQLKVQRAPESQS